MRMRSKIAAAALMLSFTILSNAVFPGVRFSTAKGGTYGDLVTDDEMGNVIVDNLVGNGIDMVSDAMQIPGTIGAGVELANGGGIMVTHQAPNPAAKWYSRPSVNTAGKILKVGGFFIGTYDTVNDLRKMWSYQSPDNYTYTEAAIDHGLYVADVGMGMWAVGKGALIFGGTLIAGGTVGAGLLAAAGATAGIYAVSRVGVQVTRAMYNAGYFGKVRDGMYYGWQGFKKGASAAGGYIYEGWQGVKGAAGYTKDLVMGGFGWISEGLTGLVNGRIADDFVYGWLKGLYDEIPDPSTGIGVYKPNIYIYSEIDMDVAVKLGGEDMITASEPRYIEGSGWNARVRDGSINGAEDYLFYEAIVPDRGFQKGTGWIVKASSLEYDMEAILELYGFNETEKKDFMEYWKPVLADKGDFAFYPQETDAVDRIMPLFVSPKPKNIYRIWFYIEKSYEGQRLPEPAWTETIKTHRDALVEWGGVYRPD